MSVFQGLVSPRLPTILEGHASVDIPGQDLLLGVIPHVQIVPAKLDIATFEDALSKTLQLYPHAAGQLRCSDGRWSIELTNAGVPVDIDHKPDTTSDKFLSGDWVAQKDLSPFLSQEGISRFPVDDGHAPLLRFQLTFFDNETSIGVLFHHTLGDDILLFRLMHALSQFYQGLPLEHAPPTFEKYHFPTPPPSTVAEVWPHMPHLHFNCLFSESKQLWSDFQRDFLNMKWRFDDAELAELRSALSRGQKGSYLSKQDCLSAYIVAVLNHNASKPIKTVQNVCSYRKISAPFVAEDVAGTMIYRVTATVPTDMTGIATALRKTLAQYREPNHLHKMMAVASDMWLRLANAGRSTAMNPCDDTWVTVNSIVGMDWSSVHYGCPDGTRFYRPEVFKHWLRCFRSNPTKDDDGVWHARHSVEISIAVRAELRPKLLETLARGFQYIFDREKSAASM